MKALCFSTFGGSEVLEYRDFDVPTVGPTDVLVRMKAIGLNFADIYRRKGNYHVDANQLPWILGYEGAGVVEKVGNKVTDLHPGDHIGFADVAHANAEFVVVPHDRVIPLPSNISFETAASVLLQGLTAHYLVHDSFKVNEGDDVVIHAAAGGVGHLLIQLAKLKGARVLGLTSSADKAHVASSVGADAVALYSDDWVGAAHAFSQDGKGCDSVGSTLMGAQSCFMVRSCSRGPTHADGHVQDADGRGFVEHDDNARYQGSSRW